MFGHLIETLVLEMRTHPLKFLWRKMGNPSKYGMFNQPSYNMMIPTTTTGRKEKKKKKKKKKMEEVFGLKINK